MSEGGPTSSRGQSPVHAGGEAETILAPVSGDPGRGFEVGELVGGKYRVERVAGEGGLGMVVVAHDEALDRKIAIKYLRSQDPRVLERFVREARLAGKLRSEHVVRVHDVGTERGIPYMVMEYLEGEDLATVLEREGRLDVERAVDCVLQVCEALAEAHSAGVVHRDLKPENLFVVRMPGGAEVVKILDFGISKQASTGGLPGRDKKLTLSTDRFGTPAYMAPEHVVAAANADHRSDIWSLGVVLFELLTGKVPFDADSIAQLYTRILKSPPSSLVATRPGLPPRLELIVTTCLAKNPAARYQNVAELAQELQPFGKEELSGTLIRHIKSIVKEAGASVRPPTPYPGTIPITPKPLERSPVADAVREGTLEPSEMPWAPNRRRRRALVALLALGVIGAAAFLGRGMLPPSVLSAVEGVLSPASSASALHVEGAGGAASAGEPAASESASGGESPSASAPTSAPSHKVAPTKHTPPRVTIQHQK